MSAARLSAHDASFLYTETASGPMHGVGISVLAGPATFEQIYAYYEARVHLVPKLRQKLALVPFNLAHPVWVDDANFRLDNHVRPHPVPDGTTLDHAVDLALQLGEKPLDRSRPLWLTYVLENVEGRTLVVSMSHHAFVDGATAVAMGIALTDTSPDAPPPPAPGPWRPQPAPSQTQLWSEALGDIARANVSAMLHPERNQPDPEVLRKGLQILNASAGKQVMQAPWNAALVGPKREFCHLTYTLDQFKAIRKSLGGTINDIAVAVVTEAAARYLEERGELVRDRHLRLMCPVNVRDPNEDPLKGGGNRVSAMFPVLPAWRMKIDARYKAVREEMQHLKESGAPEALDALQSSQRAAPPVAEAANISLIGTPFDPTLAAAQRPLPVPPGVGPRPAHTGFNFTLTNVPGVPHPQYVAGYEVLEVWGTLMLGGTLGFGVGLGSYNGKLMFGFTAEPRLMPDVEHMRDLVGTTFAELAALANSSVAPTT